MDKSRSMDAEDYQHLPVAVAAMSKAFPARHFIAPHSHIRAQLLYAISGMMRVVTQTEAWMVPPQRAVWIAPNIEHEIECLEAVAMRTLYVRADHNPFPADACHVLAVTPLIRELILRLLEEPPNYEADSVASLCSALLLRELALAKKLPLHLPLPGSDEQLLRVCRHLLRNPSHHSHLDRVAEIGMVSVRTLERMFTRELGMTFGEWRQQALLCEAIARLSRHESVSDVARKLGYSSVSAFSAMFKRAFGFSPKQLATNTVAITGVGEF